MPRQFIFIMTDSQRADMVGCYGNKDMLTPSLDSLAKEGIRFTNAYTTQPVCGPARSAIFTGLYPHSNGAWGNCMGLESTMKSIGQRLSYEKIHTAYIGKWHLDGGDYFGAGKCPDGWDKAYWYDMRNYLDELTEEQRIRVRDDKTIMEGDGYGVELTYGRRCSDRAIDFIEKHKDEDFLLVVSYDEPHHPFIAPKKYAEMYKDYNFPVSENVYDMLENKPEYQKVWAGKNLEEDRTDYTINNDLYFGSNTFIDDEIGRVIKAYHKNTPEALIMYTSDHGDMLGSHHLSAKGPNVYEEIANIPFIMAGNAIENKGVVNKNPISHIDIVPTMIEFFDAHKYKMLQGKSLMPLLKDSNAKINDEIFIEFGRYEIAHDYFGGFQPLRCIFDGRYKLSINLLSSDELYDLEKDSAEMNNLIEDENYFAIRDKLHDKLLNWMNETRDPFRGYYWERRPWRKDAIVASWNGTGMTRQKDADYDEEQELVYNKGITFEKSVYQVVPAITQRQNEVKIVKDK